METETYLCTGRVRYDGAILTEGDELELNEEQAAPLLIDGAIVRSPTARKKPVTAKKATQEKTET